LLAKHAEAGIDQSLQLEVMMPRKRPTRMRGKLWQRSQSQQGFDYQGVTEVGSPQRAVNNVGWCVDVDAVSLNGVRIRCELID